MATSANQIRRYYQTQLGRELDRTIQLADRVAALAAQMLEADLVAVFHQRGENAGLVPVAYHWIDKLEVVNLNNLEEAWRHPLGQIEIAFRRLGEKNEDAVPNFAEDSFASDNHLGWAFRFPVYRDGELRALIVGYWVAHPGGSLKAVEKGMALLGELLLDLMSTTSEMRSVDNFSIRLSDLLTLYEMPLNEERYRTLLAEILKRARQVVPDSGCCLLTQDQQTGKYRISNLDDASQEPGGLISSLPEIVNQKFVGPNSVRKLTRGCLDLSNEVDTDIAGLVALPIRPEPNRGYVLAVWTRRKSGFTTNDLELLRLFSLFAEVVLKNGLLVRSLRIANRQLKKTSEKFANVETLAALADMTSGVAHEFNNLIAGVVGRVQLLQLKVSDKDTLKALAKIEKQVLEGAETVHRIQQFATSARYKRTIDTDLGSIVRHMVHNDRANYAIEASRKEISIVLETDVDSAVISGCEEDLRTALEKLLDNAVEHSPDGSRITLSLTGSDSHFVVSVADEGPGIPEDVRHKVCYPFYSTKSTQAAGLGLSIVHGIVTRHGGQFDIESSENGGVKVVLTFDLSDADCDISEITSRSCKSKNLKILVVDDDFQIRDVLSDMLALDGHQPVVAEDGFAALEVLKNQEFDLMITDLGMPGMSGLELSGQAHTKYPHMGIAMITGWGMQLDEQEINSRGIQRLMAKPFHLNDIKKLISDLSGNLDQSSADQ